MAFDLQYRLSGGASNADPALSIGGAMSSVAVDADALAWASSGIAGVTLVDGFGNTSGAGTLVYTYDATDPTLTWQPPGSTGTYDRAVVVPADGTYLLDTFDHRAITVDVVFASLPGADDSKGVTVTAALGNLFDAITSSESMAGATEHRCGYIRNNSGTLTHDLRLFIARQPTAGDRLAIGVDAAGVGGTATTIAAAETEPDGVTFVQPQTYADGGAIAVTLAPGEYVALWVRRTVAPVSATSSTEDLSRIGIFSLSY